MSKELPFFKFNSSEWLTGNISYESYHIQGVFIKVCAEYWNRDNSLSVDDAKLRTRDALSVDFLIEKAYLKVKKNKIVISFLDEERNEIESKRLKLSESGRKGGLSRAKALLKGGSSIKNKNKEEEIEEEDKKKPKAHKQPSLDEVKEYFKENGYTEKSAVRAFNYYDIANWVDSKGNKVKSWKQKMQSVWFKPENKISEAPKQQKSVEQLTYESVMRQMEANR